MFATCKVIGSPTPLTLSTTRGMSNVILKFNTQAHFVSSLGLKNHWIGFTFEVSSMERPRCGFNDLKKLIKIYVGPQSYAHGPKFQC